MVAMAAARPRCPHCNASNLHITHESTYEEDVPLEDAALLWVRFAFCISCAREFDERDGEWIPRRRPAPPDPLAKPPRL